MPITGISVVRHKSQPHVHNPIGVNCITSSTANINAPIRCARRISIKNWSSISATSDSRKTGKDDRDISEGYSG
jgi:hypothetical protein